jgi:integrase
MGPRLKLPPYVHAFVDRRSGKIKSRYYFRRRGFPGAALPGQPFSPQFMAAYEAAMHGVPVELEIGASRTKPGTVTAAIVSYYNSGAFQSLVAETRRGRRAILERFRAEHGDKRIALLQRAHIDRMVAARASTPSAALNFLKAMRALMAHCVANYLRDDDPTRGVKSAKIKTEGHATWGEHHIAAFEARHPIGSRARLALGLLLYTGQRRSDVVRLGRQHVRNGVITVRQQKTGVTLAIPVHPILQDILDATPNEHLTFLTTHDGKPFVPAGFGNLFHIWCREAGLPRGLSAHGLRKTCCTRLAEAGCSEKQIAAISGHATLREVARYTRAADQARLARSAMETITGTSRWQQHGQSGNMPPKPLSTNEKK